MNTGCFILEEIIETNGVLLKENDVLMQYHQNTLKWSYVPHTHGLFPSNLTTKFDEMVKVVPNLKLDNKNDSFYNLMAKVTVDQKFDTHLHYLFVYK